MNYHPGSAWCTHWKLLLVRETQTSFEFISMHYQKHKHTCLPSQESGVCYCPVLVRVSPKDRFRRFLLSQQHWHYYWLFSNHEATFPVLTHFFCVPPEQHKGLRLSASGSPTVLLQQTESNYSAVIMNFNLIIPRITMWWRCTRIIAAAALVHYHHQHTNFKSTLTKVEADKEAEFLRYQHPKKLLKSRIPVLTACW